jgi:exosortase A-associated hydrolase 2
LIAGATAAQFIDSAGSRVFVLARRPERTEGRCVLIVAPFADEMNKSRRMLAEVSRGLAGRGIATVLPDYFGTGDSEGEFRDADLERWKSDIRTAVEWSAAEGHPVTGILAVRLGCALAAHALQAAGLTVRHCVFWQPVTDGERYLAQFLRLRVAASMMEADRKESVGDLRERLRKGEAIEVAGYEISSRLAEGLGRTRLQEATGAHLGRIDWIELVRSEGEAPTPVREAVAKAREAGLDISLHPMMGEPFWSSVEIVTNEPLIARTVELLSRP